MKVNVFENVKKNKTFRTADIFVYLIVLILCAGLFLGFIIIPSAKDSDGFKIFVADKEIFVFYYDDCSFNIDAFDGSVNVDDHGAPEKYVVTVHFADGGYNVITAYPSQKKAEVTDADCSSKKDCVYSPAIKGGSGAIYCMPHKLKVVPIKSSYRPLETGGL